jgi:glucosyl-3-phosphoglycerate phosphatase
LGWVARTLKAQKEQGVLFLWYDKKIRLMDFKNHYFALRHGESVSNTQGIILSHREDGKKEEYTLTKNGEAQVRASVTTAKESGLLDERTAIFSSPFSRCKRTAGIAKEVLGVKEDTIIDARLSERWFGDWEGTSNANYQKVWNKDIADAHHKEANVESTAEVLARVTDLIKDLETMYSGRNILLVSHGDALQILQTFFKDISPSHHRGVEHLQVAEIRKQ